MKNLFMLVIAVMFMSPLIFGIVNAQQANICRLHVEWAPPGFYADDQCTNIGNDPINQSEQDALWFQFRAKPQGSETWTIIGDSQNTSVTYTGLTCGNYDVEVQSHFEGVAADCPATGVKAATAPKPGCATILP